MKKSFLLTALLSATLAFAGTSNADLISEFEPNPAGADGDTTFELSGAAGQMFSYNILSIENDGYNGTVDRAYAVSGT